MTQFGARRFLELHSNAKVLVFLSGGGTAGSVMPLLAVAQHLDNADIHFVGTARGVERQLVPTTMTYHAVAAGKMRRYWSWRNVVDPVLVAVAFVQSLWLMARYEPAVVVSMGSFVSVPVAWAAWWCNIPVLIHQQDVQVGLAIRCMRPTAVLVTKAFQQTPLRAEWIGNPVRDLKPTTNTLALDKNFPTVFIFGGGTGAEALNKLVSAPLCDFANVIHVTGQNKYQVSFQHTRYHTYELLQAEMNEAYAKANVVVARAGLGTISELAVLGKPAVIIPMPGTHQVANAEFLRDHHATLVFDQNQLTPQTLAQAIQTLLADKPRQNSLRTHIQKLSTKDAAKILATKIKTLSAQYS